MHDLSLFEIDRSYHQVTGEWLSQDEFRSHGYTEKRFKETLRIVAPNEALARTLVEEWNRTGFNKEQAVTIDEIRRHTLNGAISRMH